MQHSLYQYFEKKHTTLLLSPDVPGGVKEEPSKVLLEIDRLLRTESSPHVQHEAILFLGVFIEHCAESGDISFVHAAFLKLADIFHVSTNEARHCVLSVLRQAREHTHFMDSQDNFIKRFFIMLASNDVVTRTLALRALGVLTPIVAHRTDVQHGVVQLLPSSDDGECRAAIDTVLSFLPRSVPLSAVVLDEVERRLEAAEATSAELRVLFVRLMASLHPSDAHTCKRACERLAALWRHYVQRRQQEMCHAILDSLCRLSQSALVYADDAVQLLYEVLRSTSEQADAVDDSLHLLALRHLKEFADAFLVDQLDQEVLLSCLSSQNTERVVCATMGVLRARANNVPLRANLLERLETLAMCDRDRVSLSAVQCLVTRIEDDDDAIGLCDVLIAQCVRIERVDVRERMRLLMRLVRLRDDRCSFEAMKRLCESLERNRASLSAERVASLCLTAARLCANGDVSRTDAHVGQVCESLLAFRLERDSENSSVLVATVRACRYASEEMRTRVADTVRSSVSVPTLALVRVLASNGFYELALEFYHCLDASGSESYDHAERAAVASLLNAEARLARMVRTPMAVLDKGGIDDILCAFDDVLESNVPRVQDPASREVAGHFDMYVRCRRTCVHRVLYMARALAFLGAEAGSETNPAMNQVYAQAVSGATRLHETVSALMKLHGDMASVDAQCAHLMHAFALCAAILCRAFQLNGSDSTSTVIDETIAELRDAQVDDRCVLEVYCERAVDIVRRNDVDALERCRRVIALLLREFHWQTPSYFISGKR